MGHSMKTGQNSNIVPVRTYPPNEFHAIDTWRTENGKLQIVSVIYTVIDG